MTLVQPEPLTAELEPARQFDFWLGDWDCTWSDADGSEGSGTSTVYLDLDGHVLVESFDARPSSDYQRLSLSAYDPALAGWRQTRVDNTGRYVELAGRFEGGVMDLRHRMQFRALWHSIARDRLECAWQRSLDGGDTWTTLRTTEYARVL